MVHLKMVVNWGRSIGWNLEFSNMEITQIITDGAGCYPWREVFAWWPVKTITGKRVWGIKIHKRRVWVVWGTGFHMEPEVQYATIFDLLTHDDNDSSKK